MINLLVDEAYAFDYLAIMQVKYNRYPNDKNLKAFNRCSNELEKQCDSFEKIISSQQYRNLVEINTYIFDLIDKLRRGISISAKKIDDANMERYFKKRDLQESFFNKDLEENKIIYNRPV
jgi:hypothetical protein